MGFYDAMCGEGVWGKSKLVLYAYIQMVQKQKKRSLNRPFKIV